MGSITIDDLVKVVNEYDSRSVNIIRKAYDYANSLHQGQIRNSGEPYITHPLNVAYILASMHADCDTICAGLLHDTLEDTKATYEDIVSEFNKTVADLVYGVTKLTKMNFSSKEAQDNANTRKILTSIKKDIRIIIIKLADRLHNMRTLEFKSPFKQKENALETMEIFVPIAYYIGAYNIKCELEDLSLKYLKPDEFKRAEEIKLSLEEENANYLQEMLFKIREILSSNFIPNELKVVIKNIYGIYMRLEQFEDVSKIHDLVALKVLVEKVDECYMAMRWIHELYHPVNGSMKDYICNPKPNMYQSWHSTLFVPNNKLIHAQIKTFDMERIATCGLTSFWDTYGDDASLKMQESLSQKFQFFSTLLDFDSMAGDNKEFVSQVKSELLTEVVHVYTQNGLMIELPKGSTIIDFAYKIGEDTGNTMVSAIVNGEEVSLEYQLQYGDVIKIITDRRSKGPKQEWVGGAMTSCARRRIHNKLGDTN